MTEINNRIEEVKKICPRCKGTGKIIWHDKSIGREFEGIDRESPCPDCQLSPQPLDDKELREALKGILLSEGHKIGWACKVYNPPKGMGFPNPRPDAETTILQVVDQILALLQQKIEEARELARDEIDGVKIEIAKLNKKLDDREADLLEARKQEREKTITKINEALKSAELHLCWITEGESSEPISYGLADECGDEIDIALLREQ